MEKSALEEVKNGAFARTDSIHRNFIGNVKYPPESQRYLLVVSYACPWAHRTLIVRSLLGLEAAIPLAVVHPTWQLTKPDVDQHSGWVFAAPGDAPIQHPSGKTEFLCDEYCVPPPSSLGWTSVRSVYEAGGSSSKDVKYTVPILWDLSTSTIVNNESSEIIRMLYDTSLLGKFATKNQTLQLLPSALTQHINETNEWVYTHINNGVYKCGFANTQQAYETAAHHLQAGLERANTLLSKSKFLCSDEHLTEADIRLFVTLIRHDEVYCVYFKTNHTSIVGGNKFPHLVRYMRDMVAIEEVCQTCIMSHIKGHYYTSHPTLNAYGIIPVGPDVMRSLKM